MISENTQTLSPPSLDSRTLSEIDPAIHEAIENEKLRQNAHIELIASENFTLPAIIEATGSVLTNKYAEGYPAKRYYGGCEHADVAEAWPSKEPSPCLEREYANVQPHSGSQANIAVYFAMLQPGDKILTMSLEDGGHLTHGHPKNCSGMLYEVINYGLTRKPITLTTTPLRSWPPRKNPSSSPLELLLTRESLTLKEWVKLPEQTMLFCLRTSPTSPGWLLVAFTPPRFLMLIL